MEYLQAIESALGFELHPNSIKDAVLTHEIIYNLNKNIVDHYRNSPFPKKDKHHVRPYLSHDYAIGNLIHQPVYKNYNLESGFGEIDYPLSGILKKHLLYVNSVCIHDPLIYLLDYFGRKKETSLSKERIPRVKLILEEYAILRDLIKSNIITFESGERTGPQSFSDYFVNDEEIQAIYKNSNFETEISKSFFVIEPILRDMDLIGKLDGQIDLYFPDKKYINLYAGILKTFEQKFHSEIIKKPYYNSILGDIDIIDVNRLTIDDILNLRKNEESFNLWREFMEKVLIEFYKTDDRSYSDKDTEFQRIANEMFREVDAKLKRRLHNSNYLSDVIDATQRACIGVTTAGIAGVALSLPPSLPMLIGGVTPFITLIINLLRTIYPMQETISINNHFFCLNLK